MVEITNDGVGYHSKTSTKSFIKIVFIITEIIEVIVYRNNCIRPRNSLSVNTTYFMRIKPTNKLMRNTIQTVKVSDENVYEIQEI